MVLAVAEFSSRIRVGLFIGHIAGLFNSRFLFPPAFIFTFELWLLSMSEWLAAFPFIAVPGVFGGLGVCIIFIALRFLRMNWNIAELSSPTWVVQFENYCMIGVWSIGTMASGAGGR
ncbi:hypothetical protein ROLI_013270 [Roseobacter fucihabitans]|uniref:Uncharacterized protein n=1 Tax=Roseobacter fucihabitans TaxID=1537242 RepID=A0ABZ2BQH5_9RHOB|nr:hypothetical protein [Roseobacter litoralis]MBC6968132.1 hypothetical protein [Roseobacter litoralis]